MTCSGMYVGYLSSTVPCVRRVQSTAMTVFSATIELRIRLQQGYDRYMRYGCNYGFW